MKKERINYQEAPKEIYELMLSIESYLKKCCIDHSLIELIKLRASQINSCGYCLDMHHKEALKAGEEFKRLYLLPAWEESPVYSEKEKVVLNLTEVLTDLSSSSAGVIEKAYQKLSEHYSKTQISQIVFAICQINSWNRIAITFGNIPGSYEVS